jgi:hypothetical protein
VGLGKILYNKQFWHIEFHQTGRVSTSASDMNVCSFPQIQKYNYMTFTPSFSLPHFDNM